MRVLVVVLVCSVCGGYRKQWGRADEEHRHSHLSSEPKPSPTSSRLRSLAALLQMVNSAAGWQVAGSAQSVGLSATAPSSHRQASVLRPANRAAIARMMPPKRKVNAEGREVTGWTFDNEEFAKGIKEFFWGPLDWIFETDNDEPFGLKRTSVTGMPDTFPATKDEFADPVQGDWGETASLRPLLKYTWLEKLPLVCVYDAFWQGWNPKAFHDKVDKQGPCVVVAKTRGGALVGGYAATGFIGLGEDRDSIGAFLFTWPDGNTRKPAIKLQKSAGRSAVVDFGGEGPQFGQSGLIIKMSKGVEKTAFSRLGFDYEVMPDMRRSIFTKEEGSNAELTELRVYTGKFPENETIPNTKPMFFGFER